MITLTPSKEPYKIELPYGITLTVKPLTTSLMLAAQVKARKRVESQVEGLEKDDEDFQTESFYQEALIEEVACAQIIAWQGVGEAKGEKTADVRPENIKALMGLYPLGERFFQEITLKQMLLNAAKKGSRQEPSIPSQKALSTAKDAKPSKRRSL